MPFSSKARSRSSAGLLALVVTLLPLGTRAEPPRSAAAPVAVVASPDVPVSHLSITELRRIFGLERRFWKPGQPAAVLYPPIGSPGRAYLLRHLARGSESDLRRMMLEKMYRGEIDLAPKVATTDEEALGFVMSGHGVLALVPVAVAERSSAKILTIDGPRPRTPKHPVPE